MGMISIKKLVNKEISCSTKIRMLASVHKMILLEKCCFYINLKIKNKINKNVKVYLKILLLCAINSLHIFNHLTALVLMSI